MLCQYLIIHNNNQVHSVFACPPEHSAPDRRNPAEGGAAGGEHAGTGAWHNIDEGGVNSGKGQWAQARPWKVMEGHTDFIFTPSPRSHKTVSRMYRCSKTSPLGLGSPKSQCRDVRVAKPVQGWAWRRVQGED